MVRRWQISEISIDSIPEGGCTANALAEIVNLDINRVRLVLRHWIRLGAVAYWKYRSGRKTVTKYYKRTIK